MPEKQKTCLGFWKNRAKDLSFNDEDIVDYYEIDQEDTFPAVPKSEHDKLKEEWGEMHASDMQKAEEQLRDMEDKLENSIPKEKVRKMFEELNARSGWEMLPAKIFNDLYHREGYDMGTREMEAVWHEILEEKKKQLLGEK